MLFSKFSAIGSELHFTNADKTSKTRQQKEERDECGFLPVDVNKENIIT